MNKILAFKDNEKYEIENVFGKIENVFVMKIIYFIVCKCKLANN